MDSKTKWFTDARFGMFIHWGIYAIPAQGEWVMYFKRIPVKEYEKYAEQFNPVNFNADEWVALAKKTGMKYIVITAKHHDGFSMFKTQVDKYNIVDGTPFKRDPIAELAEACRREGIKLCFYYSHVREWRHPHAQSLEVKTPDLFGNYGNFWDYPDENSKNLQIYIDEFDKPQIRELLTQYGPIGIIWFDTPSLIRPDQAQELADLIRSIQPDCLVNSRIGDGADWDYRTLGDNEIPANSTNGKPWETPMTICHAWGYNESEHNRYREIDEIICQLVEIVSLGGNYLLNVGPTAQGTIPKQAEALFRQVGDWIAVNGEAIYGTDASPFFVKPTWGRVTAKDNLLYLHVADWQTSIRLTGLLKAPEKAMLLAAPEHSIDISFNDNTLELTNLPETAPGSPISVIRLEFDSKPLINENIVADDAGNYNIPVTLADVSGGEIPINETGVTKWIDENAWISFKFVCDNPGNYEVQLETRPSYFADYGHEISVEYKTQKCTAVLNKSEDTGVTYENPNARRAVNAGVISLERDTACEVKVKALAIERKNGCGVMLSGIKLIRAQVVE